MDQLRSDSQRKAESTSAHRVALGQQQELEPESLEQQLKGNEAGGYERGTIGVRSAASPGPAAAGLAPPRPKEIPQRLSAGFCFPSGFSLVRPAFWKTALLGAGSAEHQNA